MDVDDDDAGLQEEIFQLTPVIRIGIYILRIAGIQIHMGWSRDPGMKLESPVFYSCGGNDLAFVPIVLQDKLRPVIDTMDGPLDSTVFLFATSQAEE
jgi:hypothetical protein